MLFFCWTSGGFIFYLKCINWFCNKLMKLLIKSIPLNVIVTPQIEQNNKQGVVKIQLTNNKKLEDWFNI